MRKRRQDVIEEDLRRDEEMEQFAADCLEFGSRKEELRQLYPKQWVAIHQGEIIGTDTNLETLVVRLKEEGYEPAHIPINFIDTEDRVIILAGA